MKRCIYPPLVLLFVAIVTPGASAEPAWGSNCLSCHGQLLTNTLYVIGEDTTADPDESKTGAPDRGPLPVFQTFRGKSKSLQAELVGLDLDDTYAVELKRLRYSGVEETLQLNAKCCFLS